MSFVSLTTVKCQHRKDHDVASRRPYLLSLTALLENETAHMPCPLLGGSALMTLEELCPSIGKVNLFIESFTGL